MNNLTNNLTNNLINNSTNNSTNNLEKKDKIKKYFLKTCEVLKSMGDYKHLLFSTGSIDNSTFDIDPNVGEFTVDALRIGLLIYIYCYPEINFPCNLLSDQIDCNVFTFANCRFHPEFLKSVKSYIKNNEDMILPFLPRIGSSHWYTFCIQPNKERIVILNPLENTSEDEKEYLVIICNNLIENIANNLDYDVLFVDVGLQTSKMSCGESTLMIALSIMTNGEDGYSHLARYFENNNLLSNILDINDISFNKKCTCINCNNELVNIVTEKYKLCLMCEQIYGNSIGLNDIEAFQCVYCGNIFNVDNYNIILKEKNYNKKNSELSIRKHILNSIEKESIEYFKKGCDISEELLKTKNELEIIKKKYQELLNTQNNL